MLVSAQPSLTVLDPLKYDVKIMLWFLIGIIVVLFAYSFAKREHFSAFGYELVNVSFFGEDTCKPGKENDAGLCYPKCRNGYRGVGPVCWAETENIGIGTVIGLEDCPEGWFTEGLICREPITGGGCTTRCDGNWSWSDGGFCHTRCEPIVGGRLKGRLDNGGVCPGPQGGDKPDRVDGMCYGKCPENKPKHLPGMPYLCYVGGELSYGRGVGKVPNMVRVAGKYAFLGGTD
jgi:hypothetical protein